MSGLYVLGLKLKGGMNLNFSSVWTVEKVGQEYLGELYCPFFCLWSFLVCYNFIYMLVRSFILPVTAEAAELEFSPAADQLPHYIYVCPFFTKCPADTKWKLGIPPQENNCACVSLSVLLTRACLVQVQVHEILGSLPYSCLQWLGWRHANNANIIILISMCDVPLKCSLLKMCLVSGVLIIFMLILSLVYVFWFRRNHHFKCN